MDDGEKYGGQDVGRQDECVTLDKYFSLRHFHAQFDSVVKLNQVRQLHRRRDDFQTLRSLTEFNVSIIKLKIRVMSYMCRTSGEHHHHHHHHQPRKLPPFFFWPARHGGRNEICSASEMRGGEKLPAGEENRIRERADRA